MLGSKLLVLGMGDLPPLIGNPYFMGIYKPLRTWVEFPIPYYMEMSWELIDPIAHLSCHHPDQLFRVGKIGLQDQGGPPEGGWKFQLFCYLVWDDFGDDFLQFSCVFPVILG